MRNINYHEKLGQLFRNARINAGLTQLGLATEAGVTRLNVVDLEAGKNVGFHVVAKVMEVLKLTVDKETKEREVAMPARQRVRHANINAEKYPQLKLLLWDHRNKVIEEKEAFYTYEKNARFLDPHTMPEKEKALLKRLTNKYGNGVFCA